MLWFGCFAVVGLIVLDLWVVTCFVVLLTCLCFGFSGSCRCAVNLVWIRFIVCCICCCMVYLFNFAV